MQSNRKKNCLRVNQRYNYSRPFLMWIDANKVGGGFRGQEFKSPSPHQTFPKSV